MSARLPAAQRRLQIADAILELLGSCSVEAVSTRRVAELVGISQPALFRHFSTRDELLIAAVERVREELAPLAEEAIRAGGIDGIRVLAAGLFHHAKVFPGIPRLLFYGGAMIGSQAEEQFPTFHKSLRLVVSMQRNLVAQLLSDAVENKTLTCQQSPERAARFFVGLVQGMMFQFRFDAKADSQAERNPAQLADSVVEFWLSGLCAEVSIGGGVDARSASQSSPVRRLATTSPFHELDVRPILESGVDPLVEIQQALANLPAESLLKVTAPFQPNPLLAFLQSRGLRTQSVQFSEQHWVLEILGTAVPDIIDLRELEAPEPLEQCLHSSARLAPGQDFYARLPRVPRLLLPRLQDRGLRFWVHEEPDSSALILIRNPAP
jgi:AcrR family transcriptional regulator